MTLHTKSHIFLKISIFYKKIITFSSSAHLMKKSTFLPKFHFFFFCTILTFLHQKWYWQNTCHFASKFARNYFINELRNSIICPKTDAFCIKCYFLPKENNATKNWHFSKTEDTSLRILNISIKNKHFWKWWLNPSKLVFLQDFRIYQWSTHNEKINTCRTSCHIFTELTTKILLKPIVIFPKNWQLN